MASYEGPLGRKPPTDDRHLLRYSLTPRTMPRKPTAVVLGSNWYQVFDTPVRDSHGKFWLTHWSHTNNPEHWGRIRGGHAYCLIPPGVIDSIAWWKFYNQGIEGACVGFASSRAQTLHNRRRYDARWVYHEALKIDEWPGEADEGTSVRAGMDVLRTIGMVRYGRYEDAIPRMEDGIEANRWASSVEEIAACLSPVDDGQQIMKRGYVTMLNSWGESYPHHVRIALDVLDRIIFGQNGDATVVTDRN